MPIFGKRKYPGLSCISTEKNILGKRGVLKYIKPILNMTCSIQLTSDVLHSLNFIYIVAQSAIDIDTDLKSQPFFISTNCCQLIN